MHASFNRKKQLDANIVRGVYVDIVVRTQGTAVVMLSEGHTEYRDSAKHRA